VLSATPSATGTNTPTVSVKLTETNTPVQPGLTATNTLTVAPTGVLTIGPVKPYPNPINPIIIPVLRIAVNITGDADRITLKIYTCAYRLIMEQVFEGADAQQIVEDGIIQYNSDNLKDLSAGTYYYVIIAENGTSKVRSKVDKIIILK
jgi:hypothetical protein